MREAERDPRRRAVARAARPRRAPDPRASSAPDGRPVVSFASNDYLGLTQHPAVVAAAHAALDRWGAGSGSARLIVGSRPVHTELEHALADVEAHRARRRSSRPASPPTSACSRRSAGPDVARLLRRAQPRVDHRRLPPRPRRRARCTRHADPEHVDALLARRRPRRGLVVTDTVFSMDGDVAPVDDLARRLRPPRRAARARRGPRGARPDPDVGDADVVRGRHAVEDARRARRLRRGHRRASSTCS